ncbi:macrophage mannose receptor 1 [Carassius carassius]|uniref:macrophage mannose receptor 1 n=1 Tax=Carassius carassius TaxID=217509 RepID=UPI002869094B|nr:macrophage mannose receptor 1 [Carassius carassius]
MIPKTFHLLVLLGLFSKTSCYFILIQEAKTWTEARSYCKQYHVDLATIQSDEDRSKIQEVAAAGNFQSRAWMGLYDGLFDWRWSYQDQNLAYSNWASGEDTTSRTQRMCGLIRNTRDWHAVSCEEQKPFFCYQGNSIAGKFNFNHNSLSWRDAQRYCSSRYKDLAFISDSSDNNALVLQLKYVYDKYEAWIGLSKNLWLWSDQSKVIWLSVKWADGQPDNASGNEKCGFVHETGLIGDDVCSHTLPFFCTKRMKTQTVRFAVTSAGSLNESAVMEALEKQMNQILSDQQISGSSVTWRVQPDGQIFQQQRNTHEE